jgi:hypothetical protein
MKTGIVVAALILGLFRQADAGHVYTYGAFDIYPTSEWGAEEPAYMLATHMLGGDHYAAVSFREGTLSMVQYTIP